MSINDMSVTFRILDMDCFTELFELLKATFADPETPDKYKIAFIEWDEKRRLEC